MMLAAIISVVCIFAVLGMMHFGNSMNRDFSNMNQVSFNDNYNNMMIKGFYISSAYTNHMNGNHFSYMENSFSNSMIENNLDYKRYKYRSFGMV